MIDLKLPQSTVVGKPVPKTAFYKHLEVNAHIKQHFVDDVASIQWLNKLAPSTLNVADGETIHEIVVFLSKLKEKDCPDDVFLFIDQHMPRHVVFILEFEDRFKILLNYKEWKDEQQREFNIVKSFATEWMPADKLSLLLEGQSMDVLYESMAGQVSGFGTSKGDDTKRIVELEELIAKTKREVDTLQRRIRNEQQLNRQMELNGKVRSLKKQLALWQIELQKLKK